MSFAAPARRARLHTEVAPQQITHLTFPRPEAAASFAEVQRNRVAPRRPARRQCAGGVRSKALDCAAPWIDSRISRRASKSREYRASLARLKRSRSGVSRAGKADARQVKVINRAADRAA